MPRVNLIERFIRIFLCIFFLLSPFLVCSDTFATRSRLSGMGDLSIVIEDESNMINLWDFAHNPAGLLEDEKKSVVRGDFMWDSYEIRNLRGYDEHGVFSKYKADGDLLDNWSSLCFRKEGKFALSMEGNYFSRQTDFKETKSEFRYPEMLLTFSKSVNPLTCLGVNLQYVKYTSEYSYKPSRSVTRSKTKYFRTELGARRRFSPGVTLAVLLGYDSMEADRKFYLSDFHTFWVSIESIVEIEQKFKLGLETVLKLKRADFQYSLRGNESYYFTILRLTSIYDLTSKLRIGILYFHNELFSGFHYPLDSFISPISVDGFAVGHLGLGCSYRFNDNVLVGLEGHFRDSSQPHGGYPQRGFIYSSSNLGAEAKISKTLSIRGGYIRAATNQNPGPGYPGRGNAWENTLTLGLGYQPCEWNSVFEFSYRYAFKKFEQYYIDWDVESRMHVFSLSLKKVF